MCIIVKLIFFTCFFIFFQVMIQPHNRHAPMSLYLASLSVFDTIELSIGKSFVFSRTVL